jgi:hypothetical protein
MTIFKSQHTSGNTLWRKIRGFFGATCDSYIDNYKGQKKRLCKKAMGHACRHSDGEIGWAYGDNWLRGEK